MLYLAHAQQPTSVTHALKCDLLQPSIDCLVVCKHNKIEVHKLEPTGLRLVLEKEVFGAVECLAAVKPQGASLPTLLVLTASLDFFALSLSPPSSSSSSPSSDRPPTLTTVSSYSLRRPSSRTAQYTVTLTIDPHSRCIIAHVWDGELWVVPLKPGGAKVDVGKGFELKLPELSIRSFEALDLGEEVGPTVSFVYSDYTGKRFLRTRTLNLPRKAFDEETDVRLGGGSLRTRNEVKKQSVLECEDLTAETVIPVPAASSSSGGGEAGVLVLAEESVSFVSVATGEEAEGEGSPGKGKGKATGRRRSSASGSAFGGAAWRRKCDLPVSHIKCWTAIDSQPDTFLLGDVIGKLFLLRLARSTATGAVETLSVTELGDASAPEKLVYLEGGFVFVGSHFGDSQLVRIPSLLSSDDGDDAMAIEGEAKEGLDLVATWTNLAPIVDFCVVDEPALGQSYIVTCSGAHQDGSLRLVRHGVGLKDLGSVDFGSVQRVWGVKVKAEGKREGRHDALVLSQVDSTRFLAFEADGIEEVASLPGFSSDVPTLAAGMLGGTAVQVTGAGVSTLGGAKWTPEGGKKITVAEVGEDAVVVAMEGGDVRKLQLAGESLQQTATAKLSYDVACLDVNASLGLVAAGQWTANTVAILSLSDLSLRSTVSTETTYHIRSVLFATFPPSSAPYLFIGLGDGTLLSTSIDTSTGMPREGTRKSVALGTRPITMTSFTATGGVPSVLVNSDRPTVVTRSNDRLQYASVNVAGVVAATSFDAPEFNDSLVLALPDSLRIARIDELSRMHVDTLPLEGEQPRRIAHSDALRAFGVVCLREELDRETGEETVQGSFKIIDDTTFAVLHDFAFKEDSEQGLSVITAPLGDEGEEHFIVGTAEHSGEAAEAEHGRLLAFRYAGEKTYELAHAIDVGGAAYSVASLPGGRLACSANAFVHVYEPSPSGPGFKKLSSWGGAFVSVRLASRGNTVLVADAFRSIVMLEFDPKLGTLSEEARDYNAHGARSLAALGEEEFIGADVDHNVFTVGRGQPGTGALAAPGELSPLGAFHVGEYVTQFANGSLVPKFVGENAPGRPKLIFATSTGSIGVIAEVEDPSTASLLSGLERNMRRVVRGLGDIDQLAYRTFKKDKRDQPPAGFIDGAFVETLVDLNEETVEQVMRGGSAAERLNVGREEVVRLVEEMGRLH